MGGSLLVAAAMMFQCWTGPLVRPGWERPETPEDPEWDCWFYTDYENDGDTDLSDWAYFQNDTGRFDP
jgi:hypothetical protein